MAITTVGKLRFNPTGSWVASTAYAVDDIVTYKNKYYACIVANSSATTPDLNTSQFTMIGGGTYHVGEWSNATAYAIGDMVTVTTTSAYNNFYNYQDKATYICLVANTNSLPTTSNSNWKQMSNGLGRDKFAFLGAVNEGYVPPLKATWDGYALSTTVGMGDSFSQFKTPGTAQAGINSVNYINKRYGYVTFGNNNVGHTGHYAGSDVMPVPCETPFANNSWYDGSLPTSPSTQKPRVIQVETDGNYGTLVLFDNGEVHYAGYNGHGQRGDGTTDGFRFMSQCGYANVGKSSTTTVLRDKKVIRIASSCSEITTSAANFALVRNADDSRVLYAWGYNGYGQLGQNNTSDYYVPTVVPFDQSTNGKIIEIWAMGANYCSFYLLTDQGKMFACGYNGNGQLGIGNQSNTGVLTLVKAWGTGSANKIKKFNTHGGGTSAPHMLVVRGDNTLWTWGYNGYGQLGHGHTYNCAVPIQVYTTGYSGVSGTVTSTGGAGTPTGTAMTDVQNAWSCGGNGYGYTIIARGASATSNTAYACGYNGYYNMSIGQSSSASTNTSWSNVVVESGSNLVNLTDVTANQGGSSSYMNTAFRNAAGEWFWGGYNNAGLPVGHADSYNARDAQDPQNISSNYRAKRNGLFPRMRADKTYWKSVLGGYSSNKWCMHVDLKTGQIYNNSYGNDYYFFTQPTGGYVSTPQKMRHA